MKRTKTLRGLTGTLCAGIVFAGSLAPVGAVPEAQLYVTENWPSSGPCRQANRWAWEDMVWRWYSEMTDGIGGWRPDLRFVDGGFERRLFCDPDTRYRDCQDDVFVDDADAVMIATHGGDEKNHWVGALRFPDGEDCAVDAAEGIATDEMHLGDTDAEFLHLSSCNSMDDDNLPYTRYLFEDPVDSPVNGRRLHVATGFHGIMWISNGFAFDYEDFAFDGFFGPVGLAWMDNQQSRSDQCPIAYSIGPSFDACVARLRNERYNTVFPEPPSISYWCVYFFDQCDPQGEGPFNLS